MGTVALPTGVATGRRSHVDVFAAARAALLLAVAVAVLALPAVGVRTATLDDLARDARAGHVMTVHAQGALPPGAFGFSHVSLLWRTGDIQHRATVRQVQHPGTGTVVPTAPPELEDLSGNLGEALAERVGVPLDVVDEGLGHGGFSVRGPLGWVVEGWVAFLYLAIPTAALFLIVSGPEPWRATRWAWFWLLWEPLALLTIPAFCLLAGPTRGVRPPARFAKRLGGWWAFVLASVGSALLLNLFDGLGVLFE